MNKTLDVRLLLVAAMTAALTACGGGGGGDSSPPAAPPPASTAPPAIVTSVPPATYPAGSADKAAFDYLNDQRGRCGFGLLAQNAKLDAAAAGHANYLKLRFEAGETDLLGHIQQAGKSGFTSATPGDRAAAAGYPASVGEGISFAVSKAATPMDLLGRVLMGRLMSGPYHARLMLWPARDVGLSVSVGATSGGLGDSMPVTFGSTTTNQNPAQLLTYPCDGATDIYPRQDGEFPNPLSASGWVGNAGAPIYVKAALSTGTVVITSWSIREVAAGAALSSEGLVLTAANDPNKVLNSSEAAIFPRLPLKIKTRYEVMISGTDSGTAFSRQFQFTTGLDYDSLY